MKFRRRLKAPTEAPKEDPTPRFRRRVRTPVPEEQQTAPPVKKPRRRRRAPLTPDKGVVFKAGDRIADMGHVLEAVQHPTDPNIQYLLLKWEECSFKKTRLGIFINKSTDKHGVVRPWYVPVPVMKKLGIAIEEYDDRKS
jgi:hypothetical protein